MISKLDDLQELFNYLNTIPGLDAGLNYTIEMPHQTYQTVHERTSINFNFIFTSEFTDTYGDASVFAEKCIPTSLIPYKTRGSLSYHQDRGEIHIEFLVVDIDEALSDTSNIAYLLQSYQFDKEMENLLIMGAKKYLSKSKSNK